MWLLLLLRRENTGKESSSLVFRLPPSEKWPPQRQLCGFHSVTRIRGKAPAPLAFRLRFATPGAGSPAAPAGASFPPAAGPAVALPWGEPSRVKPRLRPRAGEILTGPVNFLRGHSLPPPNPPASLALRPQLSSAARGLPRATPRVPLPRTRSKGEKLTANRTRTSPAQGS